MTRDVIHLNMITRLRELLAEATPTPWRLYESCDATAHKIFGTEWLWGSGHRICEIHHYGWRKEIAAEVKAMQTANAHLLVAAINALPALLAVAEAAKTHYEHSDGRYMRDLEEALSKLEAIPKA